MAFRFPWFTRDWYGGTRILNLEQRGLYADLISIMREKDGPLPYNLADLAELIVVDKRRLERVLAELVRKGKIVIADGMIRNPRVDKDLARDGGDKRDMRDTSGQGRAEVADTSPGLIPEIGSESTRDQRVSPKVSAPAISLSSSHQEKDSSLPSPVIARARDNFSRMGGSGISDRSHDPPQREIGAARPTERRGGLTSLANALDPKPGGRWRDQSERDAWAHSRCAEQMQRDGVRDPWMVVFAAENPSDPAHERSCRLMLRAAKAAGVGWVSPSRRKPKEDAA